MTLGLDAIGHIHAISSGALGCHRIDVHRAVGKACEGIDGIGDTRNSVCAEGDGEAAVAVDVPVYGERSVGGEG